MVFALGLVKLTSVLTLLTPSAAEGVVSWASSISMSLPHMLLLLGLKLRDASEDTDKTVSFEVVVNEVLLISLGGARFECFRGAGRDRGAGDATICFIKVDKPVLDGATVAVVTRLSGVVE